MNSLKYVAILALTLSVSVPTVVLADPGEAPGQPEDHITLDAKTDVLPQARDSRLVTFRYDPNRSFAIRGLKGVNVNVTLPEGETVQGFYLSDPVAWAYLVTGDNRRVLIKPMVEEGITTATLISSARAYELTLVAVRPGEVWYQRVQWQVPSAAEGSYWRGQGQVAVSGAGGDLSVDPETLNFRYRIKGKGDFVPTAVFDDGQRTYLRFDGVQDLPAIFARHGRQVEVLNYSINAPCATCILIPSVHDVLELRIGTKSVRVERRR